MLGQSSVATPLNHLTSELAAEVRRNLTRWLAFTVAGVAVFSGLMAFAVDPEFSGVMGGVALTLFVLFAGLLLPYVGLLLALVYLFDCWPAVLRGRVLRERFGVAPTDLSGTAWRKAMGAGGFWAAFARGTIVGWAFAAALVLAWRGLTGKWGFVVPSVIQVLLAAQFAARSWFVRRAVAQVEFADSRRQTAAQETSAGVEV